MSTTTRPCVVWAGRILLMCTGTLGVVLLTEGLARFVLPPVHREVVPPEVGRFDARLGWALSPGVSVVSHATGTPVHYRINGQGIRDDEVPYAKPSNEFRVVVLGDSRTFGFGVPIEKHFTTILEGYFRHARFINMGVSGFGIDQALLYLRAEGFKYRPDLVMLYVPHYGNERHMHMERFGHSKPLFVLKGQDLVLQNCPVPEPGRDMVSRSQRLHDELRRRSRAYHALSGVMRRIRAVQPRSATRVHPEVLHRLGNRIVAQMRDEARQHGAGFLLVTQVPELAVFAGANAMAVMDPSDALANVRYDLPHGESHINECGNGVLAWEIARFIRRGRLLPDACLWPVATDVPLAGVTGSP